MTPPAPFDFWSGPLAPSPSQGGSTLALEVCLWHNTEQRNSTMSQSRQFSLEVDASPVTRILRIFEERADQLRFPDIDAEKLKALGSAVQREQDAVCAMEEKLAEARETLLLAEKDLREKAERAHAYLQVFAEGNAELQAEIAEVKWSSAERSGRKRRPTPNKKAKTSPSPASRKQQERDTEIAAE